MNLLPNVKFRFTGRSAGMMDTSAPLTPPPPLLSAIRGHSNSPFGSQPDLALRRGSLNSNGSSSIIPAVRIPPPVNYSETVRIKSNQFSALKSLSFL